MQVRQIQNWGWNSPARVNVLTWCGERCTLKALFSQFCWMSVVLHFLKVIFSLKCIVIVDGSSSMLRVLSRGPSLSLFDIWYASCHKRGFRNLVFPMWFVLLGGSFVFLNVGPSTLFLVFPLFFWVLWFIYDWQGFITPGESRVLWKTRFWKEKKTWHYHHHHHHLFKIMKSVHNMPHTSIGLESHHTTPHPHWLFLGFTIRVLKETSSSNPVMSPPTWETPNTTVHN